ncbi:transcriptional regulator [Magnetospira sp. QH-2]|uniref:transcriptional regulator n=1 Tax=Magnetospira sp. (strain QH-2) TaxID=1288970 RepID=UPI0003E81942|nr:transcriptional regulator [Magnetospira sp. QH-2]CCQ73226.1 Conserved protein of unknown function. Similar to alanyl-tRNA synthetase from Magnetospirillum gryphiswaldense [Magnetospira sp. QH-2]
MYADQTLTPKEATRLCALGTLAQGNLSYAALASSVRHFISRITGPSLDLMGSSIELLKYEGLIEALDGSGLEDNATLSITEKGHTELRALLTAPLRSGTSELNKLITALKFRYLHLLDVPNRRNQAEMLIDLCETEMVRLEDLRAHHAEDGGYLIAWLDHDIEVHDKQAQWLRGFLESL